MLLVEALLMPPSQALLLLCHLDNVVVIALYIYYVIHMIYRIQLAPHARRRAVPKTESVWMPVVRLASDEVTKSGRTGITTAYTENMLSRKRTLWTA